MPIYFRPYRDICQAPAPRSNRDIAFYETLSLHIRMSVAHDTDTLVDYQGWMEAAHMLHAAIKAGYEIHILPHRPLAEAIVNPTVIIAGTPCPEVLIGRQSKHDQFDLRDFEFAWPLRNDNLANHYAELQAFQENAGRQIVLADVPGEPNPVTMQAFIHGGPISTSLADAFDVLRGQDIVLKQAYPGKAMPLIYIDKDVADPFDAMGVDTAYHFMRYEGDRASLVVQEEIPMTHETRFFVLNHKVICGAACIETNTPAQNETGEQLPVKFEVVRNAGVFVEDRWIAQRLERFAEMMCAEIADEAPQMLAYTLDVALDAQGLPLIIELNPAAIAGQYALNVDLLFAAIMEVAQAQSPQKRKAAPAIIDFEVEFQD